MWFYDTIRNELLKMDFIEGKSAIGNIIFFRPDLYTTIYITKTNKLCFTDLTVCEDLKDNEQPHFIPKLCEYKFEEFDKLQAAINHTLKEQKRINSVIAKYKLKKDFE